MSDRIEYPAGIPRWFTYWQHRRQKRRYCQYSGHVQTLWNSCDLCGEILE